MFRKATCKGRFIALMLTVAVLLGSTSMVYAGYDVSSYDTPSINNTEGEASYVTEDLVVEDNDLTDINLDDLLTLTPEVGIDEDGNVYVIHPDVDFEEEDEISFDVEYDGVSHLPTATSGIMPLSLAAPTNVEITRGGHFIAFDTIEGVVSFVIEAGGGASSQVFGGILVQGNRTEVPLPSGAFTQPPFPFNVGQTINITVRTNISGSAQSTSVAWTIPAPFTDQLPAPTGLSVSECRNILTWDAVTGANGYRVNLHHPELVNGQLVFAPITSITTTATTADLSGRFGGVANVGQLFFLTVQALNTGVELEPLYASDWSAHISWSAPESPVDPPVDPSTPPGPGPQPPIGGGWGYSTPTSRSSGTSSPAPGSPAHSFHNGMSSANRAATNVRRNVSNSTTADSIISALREGLPSGVTAEWSPHTPFNIVPATDDVDGRVTGLVIITSGTYRSAINFNVVIPALIQE